MIDWYTWKMDLGIRDQIWGQGAALSHWSTLHRSVSGQTNTSYHFFHFTATVGKRRHHRGMANQVVRVLCSRWSIQRVMSFSSASKSAAYIMLWVVTTTWSSSSQFYWDTKKCLKYESSYERLVGLDVRACTKENWAEEIFIPWCK